MKPRSTSTSFFNVGGSWNSSVASFGPSVAATVQKVCSSSSQRCSLLSWVMRRGALSVKVKSSGVPAAQPASSFSFGIR